jgi:benzoyl-CoA reductase/2-hydroxyglutaryl-CoA dehydratase subunit BcrC/BadD/HgdB
MHTPFINDWVLPRLQDPLLAARVAAKAGQRIIGYVGADIPVELILAANAVPVRLRGKVNAPTPRADQYLESAFLPETRAIAEQWLSGDLDFLDAVIFPRSSDSSQRLYYYLCELQRRRLCTGPTPLLYDLATIARHTSTDHTLRSTQALATALGVVMTELAKACQRTTQRAALLSRLQSLRMATPTLSGSIAFSIARAAEFDWSHDFHKALSAWLDNASLTPSSARVLLAGSVPPDEQLHLAVEAAIATAASATIVAERIETQYSPALNSGDAITALAQRHHESVSPAQCMLRSTHWIAEQASSARAHGVIIWLIEEDEALPWELAGQIRALNEAKIPVLTLTRQRACADANTLNAISQFVRSLENKQ